MSLPPDNPAPDQPDPAPSADVPVEGPTAPAVLPAAPSATPPTAAPAPPRPPSWLQRRGAGARESWAVLGHQLRALFRDPKTTLRAWWQSGSSALRDYFSQAPSFGVAFPPLLVLSVAVFTRSLWTNYIFDEQEALLANPFVNGDELKFWEVFKVDFWGLPPTRTIGSYRPLPNVIWALLWEIKQHAWLPHFVNVIIHGINGALMASLAYRWTQSRRAGWFAGLSLVLAAIITEAVVGVVGIADVLGGLFILLCLRSFSAGWLVSALLTYVFLCLGLLSKESTMTVTPIVGWTVLVVAPLIHPERPRRWLRFVTVGLASVAAVASYAYFRRYFFPVTLPAEMQKPLPDSEPFIKWAMHEFLRWFAQPKFATDPINNPLASAEPVYRVAGALRVYFSSLIQVVFPWRLSGDYSFPQEPAPTRVVFPFSVLGAAFMLGPPLLAVGCWARGVWLEYQRRWQLRYWSTSALEKSGQFVEAHAPDRLTWLSPKLRGLALLALVGMWVPLTYFPQSNIVMLLPTVRAERFWYVPVLGTALLIGWGFHRLWQWAGRRGWTLVALALTVGFFGFQAVRARMHALDYRNDLVFWRATAKAVPNSAKAHLNYGVMLGARGDLEGRLVENRRAMELAPKWPMANIYYADTLCRLHRVEEAYPHYVDGFKLGPNDQFMIALALQCLWDEKAFDKYKDELVALGKEHPGSWLAWLVNDMVANGEKHSGVDPKYRPRGYNQGPRKTD